MILELLRNILKKRKRERKIDFKFNLLLVKISDDVLTVCADFNCSCYDFAGQCKQFIHLALPLIFSNESGERCSAVATRVEKKNIKLCKTKGKKKRQLKKWGLLDIFGGVGGWVGREGVLPGSKRFLPLSHSQKCRYLSHSRSEA